jgi:hypothetical protein
MALNTQSRSITKIHPSKSIAIDSMPLNQRNIKCIEKDLKEDNVCTLKELKTELGIK